MGRNTGNQSLSGAANNTSANVRCKALINPVDFIRIWEDGDYVKNEELIMRKGMDCLNQSLNVIEIEVFISTLMKNAYDYTQWRQEYFENAYKNGDGTQLENFLKSAVDNGSHGKSFGLK
jgi:hypothetical protein